MTWLARLLAGALFAAMASVSAADPTTAATLRVCADPDNLPFSNREGAGFENQIAAVLADAMGRQVEYTWYPKGLGFLRQTLLRGRCDLILSDVRPHERMSQTAAYYSAPYGLVFRSSTFDGISTLADPRLRTHAIGVVTGSPAAVWLANFGHIGQAVPYPPTLDDRHAAPVLQMAADLAAGRVDALLIWWPLAAQVARENDRIDATPLDQSEDAPTAAFPIAITVRANDTAWRRRLDGLLAENRPRIRQILSRFGLQAPTAHSD